MHASPTLPVASIAELQTEARRRVVARAMRIGLWAWPSFVLLDAWMCFVAFPGAPFGLFVLYRIVIALVLFGVYRASRRAGVPILWLVVAQNVAYALAALAIALMAIHLGGVRSPYMHGISIVALVRATRRPREVGLADAAHLVAFGASPRATLSFSEASRAVAFLRGRGYVLPDDVKAVGPDVLRHRIITSFEAEAEEVTSDDIVARIFEAVPVP